MPNLKKSNDNKIGPTNNNIESKENTFKSHLVNESILASNNVRSPNFNLEQARQLSDDAMAVLGAEDSLQSMLVAQMLSIHKLQQSTMIFAHSISDLETKKYYTNTAVKLSNCFVQQAGLLAKLQGIGGQKITVERVEVHQGGQAIVGNVRGGMGKKEKT